MFGYREDYDRENKRIDDTIVNIGEKNYWVSTVDVGLDMSYDENPPLYWETMIFECDADGNVLSWSALYCNRYSSKEDAIDGHANAVKNCAELIK